MIMKRTLLALAVFVLACQAHGLEFTNGFSLQTDTGAQVGIVVGLPDFKVWRGKCVFMLSPETPDLANTELGRAINEGKAAGQQDWDRVTGSVLIRRNGIAALTFTETGDIVDALGRVLGKAVALPEKKK